jgi:hypothetical protein
LLVEYTDTLHDLLFARQITPREFFIHPSNTVHNVLIEYPQNDEPRILSGEQYEDNATIPDEYLPTADAQWNLS